MKKEYTKPTLSMNEFEISTEIANLPSGGSTQYGEVVDAGNIWSDVQ